MKEKDEIDKLERIEMKKVEMKMSREEAIKAQKQKVKENRIIVEKEKEKIKIEEIKLEENNLKDIKHKIELVSKVEAGKQNTEKQVKLMKEKKKQMHDELDKELKIATRKRKEDIKIELERRKELVQQLKELNFKFKEAEKLAGYDPSETPGYGFLDEMSLVELQKRLIETKEERAKETEEIRLKALNDKEN